VGGRSADELPIAIRVFRALLLLLEVLLAILAVVGLVVGIVNSDVQTIGLYFGLLAIVALMLTVHFAKRQ
jgi:hypothetical protein